MLMVTLKKGYDIEKTKKKITDYFPDRDTFVFLQTSSFQSRRVLHLRLNLTRRLRLTGGFHGAFSVKTRSPIKMNVFIFKAY